ncbi:MAG: hypothetical protein CM1200mP29_14060 [Verrucomicrobiota bacterium]|nr:MAG: hypothetical protein CM1200mP29_14060 [Verrucomicrobiota bacterium]
MPTYEYVCEKCDHEFELFQSITANALETCPKDLCPRKSWSKGRVRRFPRHRRRDHLQGSGFYETDYRSESYKAGVKKESESNKPKSDSKSKTEVNPSQTKVAASRPRRNNPTWLLALFSAWPHFWLRLAKGIGFAQAAARL